MDPLSPFASTVTLLGSVIAVTRGICSLIKSIKNAPEDLTVISGEVQDLRGILASTESAIKCTSGFEEDDQLLNVLPTVLRRMEDKLRELEQLILGFCDSPQNKSKRFKNLDWALRGKDKAKRIRDDITSLKWPISTCLGSLSL